MILYNPTVSGSLLVTGSLTTTGTITSQTLVVQTITSSIEFNTGSTRNGTLAANTHEFTGSVSVSGSVGIGTNAPSQLLEVVGGEIKAGRVDSSNEGGQVSFGRATDNNTAWYIDAYGNVASPQLRFVDVTGAAVRMTLTGSNVGIGTSSPSQKLEVNGTAFASNFFSATGTQLIQVNTWTTFYTLAADQGMYTISIGLGDNDIATWYAYGTIFSAYSRAVFQSQTNGSLVSIRLSGMDVQVLLGSGASFARTLNYKILRS